MVAIAVLFLMVPTSWHLSHVCFYFIVLPPLFFLLVTRVSPAVVTLASKKRSFILEIESADSHRVMDLSNSDAHTSKFIPWLSRRFRATVTRNKQLVGGM